MKWNLDAVGRLSDAEFFQMLRDHPEISPDGRGNLMKPISKSFRYMGETKHVRISLFTWVHMQLDARLTGRTVSEILRDQHVRLTDFRQALDEALKSGDPNPLNKHNERYLQNRTWRSINSSGMVTHTGEYKKKTLN